MTGIVARQRLAVVLVGIGLVEVALSFVARGRWDPMPVSDFTAQLAYAGLWLVTRFASVWVRPAAGIGLLAIVFGVLDLLSSAGHVWHGGSPLFAVLKTIAVVVTGLQVSLVVHMCLAYPTGRAPDPAGRALTTVSWGYGVAYGLALAVSGTPLPLVPRCATMPCTDVAVRLVGSDDARTPSGLLAASDGRY